MDGIGRTRRKTVDYMQRTTIAYSSEVIGYLPEDDGKSDHFRAQDGYNRRDLYEGSPVRPLAYR